MCIVLVTYPNGNVSKLKFLERSKAHKISDWLRFELDCTGLAKILVTHFPSNTLIKSQIKLVWCCIKTVYIHTDSKLSDRWQNHFYSCAAWLERMTTSKKENRVETFLSHWCKMGYHTKLTALHYTSHTHSLVKFILYFFQNNKCTYVSDISNFYLPIINYN